MERNSEIQALISSSVEDEGAEAAEAAEAAFAALAALAATTLFKYAIQIRVMKCSVPSSFC